MPIIDVRVTAPGAKIVRKSLEDLSAEIPKIGRYQIYRALTRAKTRLSKPGKKVSYPLKWASQKQKIKVIIMLKKAGNLPYRRKGVYVKNFKIIKAKQGYGLENNAEQASFIGGDENGKGQQPMFKGRYPVVRAVINEEVKELPPAVVQHLKTVARQKGLKVSD